MGHPFAPLETRKQTNKEKASQFRFEKEERRILWPRHQDTKVSYLIRKPGASSVITQVKRARWKIIIREDKKQRLNERRDITSSHVICLVSGQLSVPSRTNDRLEINDSRNDNEEMPCS